MYDAIEGQSPNVAHTTSRQVVVGGKVQSLSKTAAATVLFEAFNLNAADSQRWSNEFVVLGLGPSTTLRGTTVAEVPLVQSADPTHNYARVLCVYMIPNSGSGVAVFPAEFLGCLLPDGSSRTANIEQYNNSRNEL